MIHAQDWEWADRTAILLDSRCVCALWGDFVRRQVRTPSLWQIEVICYEDNSSMPAIKEVGGCLEVPVALSAAEYFKRSLGERKVLLNKLLLSGCVRATAITGTTAAFWEQCAKRVEELGYVRTWQTPWRYSRDRKRSAALRCVHDIDCFRIIAVTRERGHEIDRRIIATAKPRELLFSSLLGCIRWRLRVLSMLLARTAH